MDQVEADVNVHPFDPREFRPGQIEETFGYLGGERSIPVWLRQHRDAQENMGVVVVDHLVRPALAFAGLIVELKDCALDLAEKVPEGADTSAV